MSCFIRKDGVEDWPNTPSGQGVPSVYFNSDGNLWIYQPLGADKQFKHEGIPIPSFNKWIQIYISTYAEGNLVTMYFLDKTLLSQNNLNNQTYCEVKMDDVHIYKLENPGHLEK